MSAEKSSVPQVRGLGFVLKDGKELPMNGKDFTEEKNISFKNSFGTLGASTHLLVGGAGHLTPTMGHLDLRPFRVAPLLLRPENE